MPIVDCQLRVANRGVRHRTVQPTMIVSFVTLCHYRGRVVVGKVCRKHQKLNGVVLREILFNEERKRSSSYPIFLRNSLLE